MKHFIQVLKNTVIDTSQDGYIIINISKLNEFWDKLYKVVTDNKASIEIGGQICLYGLSNLMLYKGIMKAYDRGNNVDLSQFKSDRSRLITLKMVQNKRYVFSVYGSFVVMLGILGIFNMYKLINPNNVNVNNTSSSTNSSNNTPSSNIINKSFIFLFSKFKKLNKINKLLIILILMPLIIYISVTYLGPLFYYFRLFINSQLIYIKLFLILMICLNILYNIITIYIINKYSTLNKKPNLYKFIPSPLKNKLLDLYEISQFEVVEKDIIINHIIKTILFMFILLLLLIIITILF